MPKPEVPWFNYQGAVGERSAYSEGGPEGLLESAEVRMPV